MLPSPGTSNSKKHIAGDALRCLHSRPALPREPGRLSSSPGADESTDANNASLFYMCPAGLTNDLERHEDELWLRGDPPDSKDGKGRTTVRGHKHPPPDCR